MGRIHVQLSICYALPHLIGYFCNMAMYKALNVLQMYCSRGKHGPNEDLQSIFLLGQRLVYTGVHTRRFGCFAC